MKCLRLFLFMVSSLFTACANDNPPDRIKEAVAYKQGTDAVIVYVVLVNKNGQPTAADGHFLLTFTCDQQDGKGKRTLYVNYDDVKAKDFKKATVGTGTSKHEALAYSFGRIPYSWFIGGVPAVERLPQTLRRFGGVLRLQQR